MIQRREEAIITKIVDVKEKIGERLIPWHQKRGKQQSRQQQNNSIQKNAQ